MTPRPTSTATAARAVSPLRHWGGFVVAGTAALLTDAAIVTALTHGAGISPFLSRIVAIAVAMIVSWLINRTVTFPMGTPPSLAELARFAAVAWSAAVLNYAIYAAILLVRPATEPVLALALASLVAMVLAYLGMRYGVFRRSG